MPWFYLSIALYVAAEIGIASWLVTFLQDVRHVSVTASSQALSLFFGMLMLGRLLGSFVVQRIGYLRSVLLTTIGALTCIAVGLFGPRSLSFFLPLTGLFFSIIFPTLTAAASESHTENVNTILGVLFTFAGLGGVLGPWLIGLASDLFGLQTGFSINLIIVALMVGSVFVLMKGNYHDSKT
jgi:fucose permease